MIPVPAEQAGVRKRVCPHMLRHSYATSALNRGMNPITLAQILGHCSLVMIQRNYAHSTPGRCPRDARQSEWLGPGSWHRFAERRTRLSGNGSRLPSSSAQLLPGADQPVRRETLSLVWIVPTTELPPQPWLTGKCPLAYCEGRGRRLPSACRSHAEEDPR